MSANKFIFWMVLFLLVSCSKEIEVETLPEEQEESEYIRVNTNIIVVGEYGCQSPVTVESSFDKFTIEISDTTWIKLVRDSLQTYWFQIEENDDGQRFGEIRFYGNEKTYKTLKVEQAGNRRGVKAVLVPGDNPYSVKVHVQCNKMLILSYTNESIVTLGCYYGTDSTKLDKGGKYFEFDYRGNDITNNFGHIYPVQLISPGKKLFFRPFYTTPSKIVYGKTKTYVSTEPAISPALYELPLVFHILTNPQIKDSHINDNLIHEIVASTNLLFRGAARDYRVVYTPTDTQISFRVEKIIRYDDAVVIDVINQIGDVKDSSSRFLNSNYQNLMLNPREVINIWIMDDIDVAGKACRPYLIGKGSAPGFNANDDFIEYPPMSMIGNIIANWFVGYDNIKMCTDYTTLAHELGHYLGLHHPFTENGCDVDNDFCDDTPNYNRAEYMTNSNEMFLKRNGCNGESFFSTNVMDYFYSTRIGFTPNQRDRMHHALKYSIFVPPTPLKDW